MKNVLCFCLVGFATATTLLGQVAKDAPRPTPAELKNPLAGGEAKTAFKPRFLEAKGIENFYQLSDTVYSGSSLEGEEAYAELQKRGIKTVVSVDGGKPDVETAKKYGFRYVHLPIGYDGVPTNRTLQLSKVAADLPMPVYIHCHHGKHRGPAAAAVFCMNTDGWTPEQALAWMKAAGTATNYAGLYKSVGEFQRIAPEVLAKAVVDLPEKTEVSPLVDAMVEIDERFDHLKLVKDVGYKQPPSHPDISPAHEALLLEELFKELIRLPDTQQRDQDYQKKMTEAEHGARELHLLLSGASVSKEKADAAFQSINNACAACHKAYRNQTSK